jgi:hypothetical protein
MKERINLVITRLNDTIFVALLFLYYKLGTQQPEYGIPTLFLLYFPTIIVNATCQNEDKRALKLCITFAAGLTLFSACLLLAKVM